METTGFSRWFERLLVELGMELWIGDREDARLLLRLMRENNFPKIWAPSPENRDLRQLLWHRHRLVQMRTRIMNQLQALAMNEGKRWKKKLWSAQGRAELEKLPLAPWASRRRRELLELLDRLDPSIKVIPYGVALHHKGKAVDIQKMGDALQVHTLLTGRDAQHGDSIGVELDDVHSGRARAR